MFCSDQLSISIYQSLQFGLFSANVPVLVYYSHLTAVVVSLFLSFFIFIHNRKFLPSRILLSIAVLFSALSFIDIALWTQINSAVIMYMWSFWLPLFITIFFLSFYFLYTIIKKKDIAFPIKLLVTLAIILIFSLSFTNLNLTYFDLYNCNASEGQIMINSVFALSFIIFISALVFGIREVKKINKTNTEERNLAIFTTIGISCFLFMFSAATYYASIANMFGSEPDIFKFEQYGYFGMTLFIAVLAYIIVRYKAFNIKLLAAQALVAALVILIGSEFFFVRNNTNKILTAVTFVLAIIFGFFLTRSVKREVEAREKVQKLAGELEQANIQQESLIRFISHEMKGYLTTSAGMFASIVEGDFNPITPMLKSSAEAALAKVREGVRSVIEILSNTNAKKGTLQYKMVSFDFGKMILEAIAKLSPDAKEKGLILDTDIKADGTYMVMGDTDQISEHVVRNLIDNSIKYTPTGSIKVSLSKTAGKILFSIKDTGVGITTEDKARLFTEGGRGKDSLSVNVHSTGYGLAIAKRITDAHSGRIWAVSEGAGKGSQFYVELPESK